MSNHLFAANRLLVISLAGCFFLYCSSCSPLKKDLRNLDHNPVFAENFTGFVLFDPEKNKILFNHQGDKYFTPASNTKLITFYLANKILGDSIPAFLYSTNGDTLVLWGTGDPSFLNPDLPASGVYDFLKGKHIQLVKDPYLEPKYGPGWAWDDYAGSYQREKAAFPIYGNAVHIRYDSLTQRPVVNPKYFDQHINFMEKETGRTAFQNKFYVDKDWDRSDTLSIPFINSDSLLANLWADTLHSKVEWVQYREPTNAEPFYSVPTDSLFKQLLQMSDNFVAEQLILLCSQEILGELNTESSIELLIDSLLTGLHQEPIWVDGSGLSRYNLITPLSLVDILVRIYQEVAADRIRELFPAGGKSGTLKNFYASNPAYIYAKTGTLRNNHSLSGFLLTRKGKWLIFSFMHNHYSSSSYPLKKEMERLLWQVHLKY